VNDIASHPTLLVLALPGIFLGFLYTLEIKFRKSPFDLSCSHHAHQELVRGITTEFSGRTLALIEIAHWYENVFLLGWVYLFFASMPVFGRGHVAAGVVFVILVDNMFRPAQVQTAIRSAWVVAAVFGFGNILVLSAFVCQTGHSRRPGRPGRCQTRGQRDGSRRRRNAGPEPCQRHARRN